MWFCKIESPNCTNYTLVEKISKAGKKHSKKDDNRDGHGQLINPHDAPAATNPWDVERHHEKPVKQMPKAKKCPSGYSLKLSTVDYGGSKSGVILSDDYICVEDVKTNTQNQEKSKTTVVK